MFERANALISMADSEKKIKAINVKVKIISQQYPWKVADIQFQEGSTATEYTEHIAEMQRVGG